MISGLRFGIISLIIHPSNVSAELNQVAYTCKSCHTADKNTIWGFFKAGSQKDNSFQVEVNGDVWTLYYDDTTEFSKNLSTIKELANEKLLMVKYKKENGKIIATEISYKTPPSFLPPEDVLEIEDLVNILKKDTKEANYVIFDVRGVSDYQEAHLPRAQNLPIYRSYKFKDRLPKDKNTLIIVYCNSYG